MLTNRLYAMAMREGEDINTYLTTTMDLRNQLRCYGESMEDRTLINLVLNGLPQSYKMIIQGITYLLDPKFEVVMEKLLTKLHCKSLHEQKRGHDVVLAILFNRGRGGR